MNWPLLAVPLLIALNAFFVSAEYAVVALRPAQIESLRARGRRRAAQAAEALKADPTGAIGAIQVCITLTNLILGWLGEPAMSAVLHRLLGPVVAMAPATMTVVSTALSFLVVTLLTVVLSELLPKALTLRYVEVAATWTAEPIVWIKRAIYPLVWLMNTLANMVTIPLGLGRVEMLEKEQVTPSELRLLAQLAGEQGVLSREERTLVLSSLTFGGRTAKHVLVPRVRLVYLDLQRTMEENRQVVEQHLHSRLPLCNGGLDHVVGVIPTKAFLAAYHAGGDVNVLPLIAEEPVFAPETTPLDKLLSLFHEREAQIVFLVDEYGGLEGIVTLPDVVGELVTERLG